MWEDLIYKAKEGGLDVIETYVFWNVHEPSPGNVFHWHSFGSLIVFFLFKLRFIISVLSSRNSLQFDFEGRNDLVRFVKTIQKAGLYAHLRIGPYVCAEWNFGYLKKISHPCLLFLSNSKFRSCGVLFDSSMISLVLCRGFPVWLKYVPGISFRTDNEPFKVSLSSACACAHTHTHQNQFSLPELTKGKFGIYFYWNGFVDDPWTVLQRAMQGFTEKIVGMMKSEKLYESQGGPIILSQVLCILHFLVAFCVFIFNHWWL